MDIDRLVEYSPSNKYESTISYIYVMYIKFMAYNIIYGIYIFIALKLLGLVMEIRKSDLTV